MDTLPLSEMVLSSVTDAGAFLSIIYVLYSTSVFPSASTKVYLKFLVSSPDISLISHVNAAYKTFPLYLFCESLSAITFHFPNPSLSSIVTLLPVLFPPFLKYTFYVTVSPPI